MALPEPATWLQAAFWVLLVAAAVTDLRWLRIPNPLVLAGLVLAVLRLVLEPIDPWAHLLAGAVVFALTLPLFAFDLMGGGDAKLFPVLGLWLGPATLEFFVLASIAAGALALVLVLARLALAWSGRPQEHFWPAFRRGGGVPLAVPLLPAAWVFV